MGWKQARGKVFVVTHDAHVAALGLKYSDGPTVRPGGGGFAFIDAPEGYEVELIEMAKSKELA